MIQLRAVIVSLRAVTGRPAGGCNQPGFRYVRNEGVWTPPLGYADMHNGFVVGPPPQPKSLSLCQEARLLCDLPSPGSESCIFVQSLSFWLLLSDPMTVVAMLWVR